MELPCASLILRTSNANYEDILQTTHTWNNINLRTLLGDMFDKYEKFNLILTQMASTPCDGALGTSASDLTLYATISGLPFTNQGYENGMISTSAVLCSVNYVRDQPLSQTNVSVPLTFDKNQHQANVTITYHRIIDGDVPHSSETYPDCIYIFKIYPVV